jgi:ATP/maltotriose-dependent transcriptional regulator MalT
MALELPPTLTPPATRSLAAEYAACRALALVGIGKYVDAAELARDALVASRAVEAQVCSNAALAISALRKGEAPLAEAHTAATLERALHSRMTECLVTAVRAFPDFAVAVLREAASRPELERALQVAGAGAQQPRASADHQGSAFSLSPREREVLSLLARGMSNRAIGEALFISTVTVKVHVRNIFGKLGVHSRAEAALRAGQLPL